MRHVIGFFLALAVSAALFFGAGWGSSRFSGLQSGQGLRTVTAWTSPHNVIPVAALAGTVAEVNSELTTAPEKINKDAHNAWILKMKLKTPTELNSLLSAADYEKFVADEGGH